jgi:hypothetical protein
MAGMEKASSTSAAGKLTFMVISLISCVLSRVPYFKGNSLIFR